MKNRCGAFPGSPGSPDSWIFDFTRFKGTLSTVFAAREFICFNWLLGKLDLSRLISDGKAGVQLEFADHIRECCTVCHLLSDTEAIGAISC